MGGGPASADVVRASCLLTFPEDAMVEPVPVDAWYLHAVGITFLRRLARDRMGDAPRLALILQRVDHPEDTDDTAPQRKRYISVSSDAVLRDALKETFTNPARVLVLHVIALDKVLGQKSIHVTPEINPNVSPEPVAPLGMVFPTLQVENAQPLSAAMALSSSFRLARSVYDFDKPSLATEKQLAHSDSWLGRSQEFGFRGNRIDSARPAIASDAGDDAPFALAAAGAQLIADHEDATDALDGNLHKPSVTASKAASDDDDIPMARIVGHASESDAPRIPSDYVMLELQHGAGLDDVPAAMPANSTSTFFISPTWHLHADELSASARLRAADREAETTSISAVARPIREWSALPPTISHSSNSSTGSSMEDSFVMLDVTAASDREPTRRRIL